MRSPAPRFLRPWVLRPIRSRAARSFVPALLALALAAGCATQGLRPAVSMKVERHEDTPKSALVYIDEQYIGTLGYVAARGVRLPEGEHRITVEKTGYFPYDVVVVSDREPIHLSVRLQRLPD
ncbi:MAG: PEGA domain-containing protein [Myxococcales bacterium]|nr:PEGA domain-containing protein [Myxococcales bacterium]